MTRATDLAPLLERFFTQRLMRQRQASPHTISSYRDTVSPVPGLRATVPQSAAFKPGLRADRCAIGRGLSGSVGKAAGTGRSQSQFATHRDPFLLSLRSLRTADPCGTDPRGCSPSPASDIRANWSAFSAARKSMPCSPAPDRSTWLGRRDHAFILTAVQTGLRLSEMTGLKRQDLVSGTGAHLRVVGKGRKERCTPLAKPTRAVLKAWLREPPRGVHDVLFPSTSGERLTVHGVQYLLNKHRITASKGLPSLKQQRVTVHRLRHTAAMELLQSGVDRAVIACGWGMSRSRPPRFIWRQHSR